MDVGLAQTPDPFRSAVRRSIINENEVAGCRQERLPVRREAFGFVKTRNDYTDSF